VVHRKHVWVTGRVQGVWFRQTCADKAASLAVTGWVRNLRDGLVEAVFEGAHDDVDEMVSWCRAGPPRAVVTAVEAVAEAPEGCQEFGVL
jgi:acylphosphatase